MPLVAGTCDPPPEPAYTTFFIGYSQGFDLEELEPGEALGFSVHFDPADQELHGLPESSEFIAVNPVGANADATMEAWIGRDLYDQPDPWPCFGPIEVRDDNNELLFTMTDICDASSAPNVRISGDLFNGVDVVWGYGGGPATAVPDR